MKKLLTTKEVNDFKLNGAIVLRKKFDISWIEKLKIGIKKSSAQITHYYNEQNLVGKQVIGVCNFPKKNIAGIVSEVLILGAIEKDGKVVLVHPSQKVENGLEIA